MADARTKLGAMIVPVSPFQQNCTLLFDTETKLGVVVDPGGDLARIEEGIAQAGFTPAAIILTHGHIDHAGGAAELAEKLKVKVIGPHRADKHHLDQLPAKGRSYGMPGARVVTPDRWLEEGDTVEAAGLTFDVFHCPGHSPGSVVLVSKAARFALVGDVLFKGSIGRTDFPDGDHAALISAINTKLLPLGDDIAFICGHGPMSTFGDERASNPYLT